MLTLLFLSKVSDFLKSSRFVLLCFLACAGTSMSIALSRQVEVVHAATTVLVKNRLFQNKNLFVTQFGPCITESIVQFGPCITESIVQFGPCITDSIVQFGPCITESIVQFGPCITESIVKFDPCIADLVTQVGPPITDPLAQDPRNVIIMEPITPIQ